MHDLAADQTGEGGLRDDRGEHHEHHERPQAGGQEVVSGDGDRIGGQDRECSDPRLWVCVAEDREPGDAREEGLECLQREAEYDVLEVNRGQRVEERLEPARHVDAEELEKCERKAGDHDDRSRAGDPLGQSGTQRRNPPRNASSLWPSRQFGGSSSSSRALPPPSTT